MQLRRPAAAAPPPRSDARVKLAERNAELVALVARREAIETAWTQRNREVREAHDRRAEAAEAINAALRAAADSAVAAIMDPTAVAAPSQSVGAARAQAQEIEDAIVVGEQVCAALTEEAKKLPRRIELAEAIRDELVREVFREEAPAAIAALFDRIHAAHREVLDVGLALETLIGTGIIIDRGPGAYPGALELRYRIGSPLNEWCIASSATASPTANAWRGAWEALKVDAAAPVPVVP